MPVAERLSPLISDALARAAAEPHGTPLFPAKGEAGLFPNTAPGKIAAKKCQDERWLAKLDGPREVYTSTPAGLDRLVEEQRPKQVLEDLLRALEARGRAANDLIGEAKRLADGVEALRGAVARVLPQVMTARLAPIVAGGGWEPEPANDLPAAIAAVLSDWFDAPTGASRDCPLPEVMKRLPNPPTLGEFHDALRSLHANGRIYLHPWTGPLYAMPDPACALLCGHEVAYYASLR